MTEKRKRRVKLMTRVTEEEYAQIQARMALVGTGNLSALLRKLALDGRIVLLDMDEIKTLVSLLRRTSTNVNQIAKRVNSTIRVYENDLAEIQSRLGEVWLALDDVLRKLAVVK